MAVFFQANFAPDQIDRGAVAGFAVAKTAFGAVIVPQVNDNLCILHRALRAQEQNRLESGSTLAVKP
jgi:hypothetical protein